jgi:hypothetical protein
MDSETKQVLASICEIIRDESRRAVGVDNALIALARAILEKENLWQKYAEEWRKTTYPGHEVLSPQSRDTLRRLDELIQRLKVPSP